MTVQGMKRNRVKTKIKMLTKRRSMMSLMLLLLLLLLSCVPPA